MKKLACLAAVGGALLALPAHAERVVVATGPAYVVDPYPVYTYAAPPAYPVYSVTTAPATSVAVGGLWGPRYDRKAWEHERWHRYSYNDGYWYRGHWYRR